MKKLLIVLLALGSVSTFAKCITPSSLDITVCAEVTTYDKGLVITNITPNIQESKKIAQDLCESFGDQLSEYKMEIVTKKSCSFYAVRGFYKGGMVSGCLDFGGLGSGKTFSKIKCKEIF